MSFVTSGFLVLLFLFHIEIRLGMAKIFPKLAKWETTMSFLLHFWTTWVKLRLHAKFQLPRLAESTQ